MAIFPNCPKCHRNDKVTGISTSYLCNRCYTTFIPDNYINSGQPAESVNQPASEPNKK